MSIVVTKNHDIGSIWILTMTQETAKFNRDKLAKWYAQQHLKSDPGIIEVIYLPGHADDREIRFVEINETMIDEHKSHQTVPVDFGVNMGQGNEHRLRVLDLSQKQWDLIQKGKLPLPAEWKLQPQNCFKRK